MGSQEFTYWVAELSIRVDEKAKAFAAGQKESAKADALQMTPDDDV